MASLGYGMRPCRAHCETLGPVARMLVLLAMPERHIAYGRSLWRSAGARLLSHFGY